MISEIYTKTFDDPNFRENIIHHNDLYEAILNKIRMILFTKPGEVLGEPNFGVDLEAYVFSLNSTNQTIKSEIDKQIYQYIPEALVVDITTEVHFIKGATSDSAIIDIMVRGNKAMSVLIN